MKKVLLAAAGLAVAFGASAAAQDGWYLKGGVGYGMPDDATVEAGGSTSTIDPEGDLRLMLGTGYAVPNSRFRLDFDVVDRYADGGSLDDDGVSTTDIQNVALMANAIFDMNRSGQLNPYVGVGIGAADTRFTAEGAFGKEKADGIVLAYQGLAGLSWRLSDQLVADFEYRYFDQPGDISSAAGTFSDFTSHDILFGLRYAFNAAPAAAPLAPPAPPTTTAAVPVAAACDDVEFIVYFEWDRSDLTDQAAATIGAAAEQADRCDITRVSIEGHADRSGGAAYNVRLSERRARTVRDELIRRGVAASLIAIEAKGESEPAVATPDGAREPLNRRSEVVISVQG